jgi:hypothetical protein
VRGAGVSAARAGRAGPAGCLVRGRRRVVLAAVRDRSGCGDSTRDMPALSPAFHQAKCIAYRG